MVEGDGQFLSSNFSSKKQASDWLALGEAIVNNNNSPVAQIRGLLFGGKIGGKELLSPSTTLNLQTCSARTGKLIAVPLPISYLYGPNFPCGGLLRLSLVLAGRSPMLGGSGSGLTKRLIISIRY